MWRFLWSIPLYIFVASIPLLSPIGQNLEYEYALAVSLILLVVLPIAALCFPSRFVPMRQGDFTPPLAFECLWLFFVAPLIFLLPGAYGYAVNLCQCSQNSFFFWMLVQVYPSWFIAYAVHLWILWGRARSFSLTKLWLYWASGSVAITLLALATLWFTPQKRLINFYLGFLHGPVYDAWIPVDMGIFLARVSHLLLGFGLVYLCLAHRRRQHQMVAVGVLAVSLIIAMSARTYPSVPSGQRHLDRLMSGELAYGNVVMRFQASGEEQTPTSRIQRLFLDAQFHVAELSEIFELENPRVRIYVYPSRDKKKLWFGGGNTDITDVVTPSIHITAERWPHPTLRHELVHALASEFGYFGLGFHPNMAFTEGLAVALAPNERRVGLDEGAASIIRSNRIKDIDRLFSPFFWSESGARAYTLSGSMINFMIDQHGIASVKSLYSGRSWKRALGVSREQFIETWQNEVVATQDPATSELLTEALYRYPGTMRDKCLHSKEDLRRPRSESGFVRIRQPLGWDPEQDYWLWRSRLEPENPRTRLQLWHHQINLLARDRLIPEDQLRSWAVTLASTRNWPPKTLEDIELAIIEADARRLSGDRKTNDELLNKLAAFAAENSIGDTLFRQIHARVMLDEDLADAESQLWRRYLAGWRARLPEISSPGEPWILTYLRLRQPAAAQNLSVDLESLLSRPVPQHVAKNFVFEWYKILGHHFVLSGNYPLAERAYQMALERSTTGQYELVAKWVRKARFFNEIAANTHH